MESASPLSGLPWWKNLRSGQRSVVEKAVEMVSAGAFMYPTIDVSPVAGMSCPPGRCTLAAQLPTGYGKTLTAIATYAALSRLGVVNRLLYIVPTVAQRDQFVDDAPHDLRLVGLASRICDVGYSSSLAIRAHRKHDAHVFVVTIQALGGIAGRDIQDLMASGRWMLVIDELHHYGVTRAFGRRALELPAMFTLAMSATPRRRNQDSAFPEPAVTMKYRAAYAEGAVKKLTLHAYDYSVNATRLTDGESFEFTTAQVQREMGASPEAVDRYVVDKKLKWSPKYISPLISIPVERLIIARAKTGLPLQMLVGAMGCLHAQMVCEQIRGIVSGAGLPLRVDWVGTGPHGRTGEENTAVLRQFCPPKRNGKRDPQDVSLDILVHVGMAGEGLDTVFVSEIVQINPAGINNQNDQENGRGARLLPGIDAKDARQVCCINVDTASPYASWSGDRIMDVFDRETDDEAPKEPTPKEREWDWDWDLPAEPEYRIDTCELTAIDVGDPSVQHLMRVALDKFAVNDPDLAARLYREVRDDPQHEFWASVIEARRRELREGMSEMSQRATLQSLKADVDQLAGSLALRAAHLSTAKGERFDGLLIGTMKRRIQKQRHGLFRSVDDSDEGELRTQIAWLRGIVTAWKEAKALPEWMRRG